VLGSKTVSGVGDRREQRAVGERALDQRACAPVASHACRDLRRGGRIVGGCDDRQARDVEPGLRRRVADARLRSDERRGEVARERAGERELQRLAVARMDERRRQRRQERTRSTSF
jgi:hypothetical protein